jgi:hypothetical protein
MALTLNIRKIARIREAIDNGQGVVTFYLWTEGFSVIGLLANITPNLLPLLCALVSIAVLVAQVLLVRKGVAAFVQKGRVYAFLLMALLFFLLASIALRDATVLGVFVLLLSVFIYVIPNTLRALKAASEERSVTADPTMLDQLLFGDRLTFTRPDRTTPRLARATASFILGALSVAMLVVLYALNLVPVAGSGRFWLAPDSAPSSRTKASRSKSAGSHLANFQG